MISCKGCLQTIEYIFIHISLILYKKIQFNTFKIMLNSFYQFFFQKQANFIKKEYVGRQRRPLFSSSPHSLIVCIN